MDPNTIANLIATFGPIIIPILVTGFTWLFNKLMGTVSPAHQAIVQPFLPVLAGMLGTAMGIQSGSGALMGMVSGLAATGGHQVVHQIIKVAKK